MDLDVVFLSRVQFALTIMFHYLFPPLTIGMGVVLVYLEAMYLRTREPIYETAAKFWTSLYAVTFAMGVATGIVMEFQFGTNWAAVLAVRRRCVRLRARRGRNLRVLPGIRLSRRAGVRLGQGDAEVPLPRDVDGRASGSMFSAVWIIVANSWQQTPAGHRIVSDGAERQLRTRAPRRPISGVSSSIHRPSTG